MDVVHSCSMKDGVLDRCSFVGMLLARHSFTISRTGANHVASSLWHRYVRDISCLLTSLAVTFSSSKKVASSNQRATTKIR